jgi:hypothetical protein
MQADPTNDPSAGDWWSQNAPPPAPYQPLPPAGPIPTNPDGTQVSGGWDAGASAPNAVPGYHWDPTYAMYVKDPVDPSVAPPVDPGTNNTGGGGTVTGNTGAVPFGVPSSGFGAAPLPYSSDPNAPVYQPLGTYAPPTWQGGDFVNPTIEDLYNSPGYGARLDSRMKAAGRQFAAQGTILNGGTLKALDRTGQDYATGEYQTLRGNAMEAYKQKYSQFADAAGMDLSARTINANQNQNTFANNLQTYNAGNSRTLSDFLTNTTARRNSELDYWNRLKDVNDTGANLAVGSR